MPYIDIDIDIDDFLNSCRDRDIEEIIQYLIDSGWINKSQKDDTTTADYEWDSALTKLRDRGKMQLSNEEEALIMSIANRIV